MSVSLAEQLRGRLPYPFETIAVAVTFSSRYKVVIKEAARLARIHRSKLILIYVGVLDEQQKQKMTRCVKECHIKEKYFTIISMKGAVVNTILKICKQNVVDLLVLGALKKESVIKHYVGSVARKISRKAKCSVLLMPNPKDRPQTFNKIAVSAVDLPKTPLTMTTAVYIANQENSDVLHVVSEEYIPMFESAYADCSTDVELDNRKAEFAEQCKLRTRKLLDEIPGSSAINIKKRVIFGKPGHSIHVFAKSCKPDLLLVNSPKKHLGLLDRLFPHDLEYLLEDLPCNLLIVHSRGF
ncbi:MAG: universal stress protein [Flavobacteriales bacterium]|nr:universal stress protein [Flavobacteriales bacterium]